MTFARFFCRSLITPRRLLELNIGISKEPSISIKEQLLLRLFYSLRYAVYREVA